MRAAALVCPRTGAGLIRSDLRHALGTDVIRRPGGVVVQVRGCIPRVVPVLARYHGRLMEAAAFAGEHLLTGGTDPERGISPILSSRRWPTSTRTTAPALNPSRLSTPSTAFRTDW
jgi:hypothetical protein